jgi:hypothetical protein
MGKAFLTISRTSADQETIRLRVIVYARDPDVVPAERIRLAGMRQRLEHHKGHGS